MPYFTYTRLNLYLDLLTVVRFQHFIVLWKANNKRKQLHNFCKEILQIFLHRCLQIAHFKFLLDTHLGFENFAIFCTDINMLGPGFLQKCKLVNLSHFFLFVFKILPSKIIKLKMIIHTILIRRFNIREVTKKNILNLICYTLFSSMLNSNLNNIKTDRK